MHDILFLLGRPFAPLYGLLMRLRAFLYSREFFARVKLPVSVISVGNLTMGGTGKTPMIVYLAKLFSRRKKTVVVSRGYGGSAKKKVNLVSDEKKVYLSPSEAGDEPRMLADSLPGVPVLTGRERVVTGSYAVNSMGAELVLMDDGFQHMALQRDLDLVLFSASSLLGNGWVCPGGPLREFFSALSRGDAFVVTGVNAENRYNVEEFRSLLSTHFKDTPFFTGEYRVAGMSCASRVHTTVSVMQEDNVFFAFCGIATPKSFKNSLTAEKIQMKGFKSFGDHHKFSEEDLRAIENAAFEAGCDNLVTTAKDFVKLKQFELRLPLWVLDVELCMEDGFDDFVLHSIGEH